MSPSRAAGQDLAESRQPLQATDRDRNVLGSLPLWVQLLYRACTHHTGVLHGAVGSLQTPRSKRARQLLLLMPVLVTASRGRCRGRCCGACGGEQEPVGPTASTGPGPAVGRPSRDGGAAGPGPSWWRGREGTPALRRELKMCLAGCPGRPRGRKGWARQGLPGWDPSTWRPPALGQAGGAGPWRPISHPAGSTGVKVQAAAAQGGRNRVLLVLALGEAGMTPRRPRSSLVQGP